MTSRLRSILAAAALAFGLLAPTCAALAQAPPPVPALPDSERRTSYSISGTTCSCAINFQLYGDGNDFANWVEVFINGVRINSTDPTFGWTITSPSGPLTNLSRPISNAVLTFNSVQTGTVQIVGARRPRRSVVFAENRGVPARDLNQNVNDITATLRELWDKTNDFTGRALQGLPGETISALPSASARAGGFLCWDGTGLVPLACAPGTSTGNVSGPNSSVDGHIPLFNGTSGRVLKDGGVPGTGTVTGPVSSTNGGFAKWNGTSGLVLQDGPAIIPLSAGGLNNNLTASLGGIFYSDASGGQILAGTATARQMLQSGASGAPAWSTATWPATTTANQLLWSSGTNAVAGLATATNSTLCTDGSGVPSICSTLPAAVQGNITALGTIATGVWQGTPVALGFGGTGQSSAAAARAAAGLNIDSFTGHGDSNYTILATDRTVGTNAAFTSSHTWTLPIANTVNPGHEVLVSDFQGTITGPNNLIITRGSAGDPVNGGTSVTLATANGGYLFKSDGVSKWTALAVGTASAGGVTSVTCGTGLSGGTFTTSGTCAVNLTTLTNSLGADVGMNPAGTFFTGPTVAQGTSGTFYASGNVVMDDTVTANSQYVCKLWDSITVIDSVRITAGNAGAAGIVTVHLSGVLASPAANIRISCKNNGSSTTSSMLFNTSGESHDSTLTVVRIQ
jgi:hypothetical protein